LKRERDRQALLAAATGGNPRFFLGTDSAPHERASKENACGCAGMFTAHAAIELYAEAFEAAGILFARPLVGRTVGSQKETRIAAGGRGEQRLPVAFAFSKPAGSSNGV